MSRGGLQDPISPPARSHLNSSTSSNTLPVQLRGWPQMIEIYLVRAMLGFLAFIATAYFLLAEIPKRTASSRKTAVKLVAAIILGLLLFTGVSWAPSVTSAAKTESGQLFASYCSMSGDEIYRTVSDVDGFLIEPPPGGSTRAKHFHSNEAVSSTYVFPPKRNYRFVEIGSSDPARPVRRYEATAAGGEWAKRDAPSARYALTWVGLTRIQEGNAGLFGEQVFIYDRLTSEILARRTQYYLVTRGRSAASSNTIRTCPQVDIGVDRTYKDGRPRNSYNFVSKVLIPPGGTNTQTASKSTFPCDPNADDGEVFNSDGSIGNRDTGVEQYVARRSSSGELQCWKLGVAPKDPPKPRTPPTPDR